MFYKIVETIHKQLNDNLGASSTYTNDRIEYVDKKVPEDVTVNRMIAIAKRNKENSVYAIGQSPALTYTYNIDLVVFSKNLNYEAGEKSLEIIERRVIKNMADRTQPIYSLTDNSDEITEQIIKVKLVSVNYDSGLWGDNQWAHIAIITYQIETMCQIGGI